MMSGILGGWWGLCGVEVDSSPSFREKCQEIGPVN